MRDGTATYRMLHHELATKTITFVMTAPKDKEHLRYSADCKLSSWIGGMECSVISDFYVLISGWKKVWHSLAVSLSIPGRSAPSPAMPVTQSQNDLAISAETIPLMIAKMRKAGHKYEIAWVPGFGHSYPTGAVSLGDDAIRTSVGEGVADILADNL